MGFFKERADSVSVGLNQTLDGLDDSINGTLGVKEVQADSNGLLKGISNIIKTAIDSVIGSERGIINPHQGYNKVPWEKNSFWNPMRHLRKVTAAATNIIGVTAKNTLGVVSGKIGNGVQKIIEGVSLSTLGLVTGRFDEDLG